MMFWLSGVLLAAALLLGGGSRAGFLGDVIAQLIAVPLLLLSVAAWLSRQSGEDAPRRDPAILLLTAALGFAVLPLIQLLPLPLNFGSGVLSGSTELPTGDAMVVSSGWWGISLVPSATWATLASTITPFAVLAGVSLLDRASRVRLTALVVGLGMLALLLGFLQVAQGPQSALRFFAFTNPTEAVGFFANRNHFAAQLYVTMIFAGIWFTAAVRDVARQDSLDGRAFLWFAAAAALLIVTLSGVALARSRAGLLLALAAIAGIAIMMVRDGRMNRPSRQASRFSVRRIAMGALAVATLLAVHFGLDRGMSRFEGDPLEDLRVPLAATTARTAFDVLPFGAGLGSFVPVYASQERAGDMLAPFANRAHNDWAEFLLETGILGVALVAVFLWWLGTRAAAVWRRQPGVEADQHLLLQRGATLVIALLLAHSLVDYPLRTTAMATLFAFACALLIDSGESRPAPVAAPPPPPSKRKARHPRPTLADARPQAAGAAQGVGEAWGADVQWPEEWRRRG